jgi:hypothetical protein
MGKDCHADISTLMNWSGWLGFPQHFTVEEIVHQLQAAWVLPEFWQLREGQNRFRASAHTAFGGRFFLYFPS